MIVHLHPVAGAGGAVAADGAGRGGGGSEGAGEGAGGVEGGGEEGEEGEDNDSVA